jgi:hypothetical protein
MPRGYWVPQVGKGGTVLTNHSRNYRQVELEKVRREKRAERKQAKLQQKAAQRKKPR